MEFLRFNIMNGDKKKKNSLCHWCNKSKNRDFNKVIYTDCNFCKQTYCDICIKKFPDIEPNNRGCMRCQKICGCILKNNNLNQCYKSRINILLEKKKLKPKELNPKEINPKEINPKEINPKEITILNKPASLQLTTSDKRKFFTSDSVFDVNSIYIIDSSSNLYLKPHKKRRLINIIGC